jgi:hypothetical protein
VAEDVRLTGSLLVRWNLRSPSGPSIVSPRGSSPKQCVLATGSSLRPRGTGLVTPLSRVHASPTARRGRCRPTFDRFTSIFAIRDAGDGSGNGFVR